jgi:hypothetical protein
MPKQLNVRVPDALFDAIRQHAAGRRMSIQEYVTGILARETEPEQEAFVRRASRYAEEIFGEFARAFPQGER